MDSKVNKLTLSNAISVDDIASFGDAIEGSSTVPTTTTEAEKTLQHISPNDIKGEKDAFGNQARDELLKKQLNRETEERKEADADLQKQISPFGVVLSSDTGTLGQVDLSRLVNGKLSKLYYAGYVYYLSRLEDGKYKFFAKALVASSDRDVDTTREIDIEAATGNYYPKDIYGLINHMNDVDVHIVPAERTF